MADDPLVSVVIPAFNAADTIVETLASVSQQTYRNLDIVVVDDGSTDGTGGLVQAYSLRDSRVRLVRKANGGVASARNEGIRWGRGAFIAFIDADDLWHPTKIAKQVPVLLAGGAAMALVYSPFRVIDTHGHVLTSPLRFGVNGWVLYRHFHVNLIGNGSSILVRRDVLDELGGYDPRLRAAGAEGCEDLLLQLRIAARYQFGELPEYLVGYRRRPDSMSSNVDQMLRSGALAMRIALAECGGLPHLGASAILNRYEWQRLRNAARRGRIALAMRHLLFQFAADPAFAAAAGWNDLSLVSLRICDLVRDTLASRLTRSPASSQPRRRFYDLDPAAGSRRTRPTPRSFRRLTLLDEAYRPDVRIAEQVRIVERSGAPAVGALLRS
jgi:glycosyltransferase involved in cell wall biosynthesis